MTCYYGEEGLRQNTPVRKNVAMLSGFYSFCLFSLCSFFPLDDDTQLMGASTVIPRTFNGKHSTGWDPKNYHDYRFGLGQGRQPRFICHFFNFLACYSFSYWLRAVMVFLPFRLSNMSILNNCFNSPPFSFFPLRMVSWVV